MKNKTACSTVRKIYYQAACVLFAAAACLGLHGSVNPQAERSQGTQEDAIWTLFAMPDNENGAFAYQADQIKPLIAVAIDAFPGNPENNQKTKNLFIETFKEKFGENYESYLNHMPEKATSADTSDSTMTTARPIILGVLAFAGLFAGCRYFKNGLSTPSSGLSEYEIRKQLIQLEKKLVDIRVSKLFQLIDTVTAGAQSIADRIRSTLANEKPWPEYKPIVWRKL